MREAFFQSAIEASGCWGELRKIVLYDNNSTIPPEQKEIRLDAATQEIDWTHEATLCVGPCARTYQDMDMKQECETKTLYTKDFTRTSYKYFMSASQNNFHRSTSKESHLQDLNGRTSKREFPKDLCKILSQGPVQDKVKTSSGGSPQDLLTRACTRSCKGLRGEDSSRISTRSSH